MSEEIWKPVVGYEGLYEVSNLGRVKSFHKNKEGILKVIGFGNWGYKTIDLSKNGLQSKKMLHRVLCEAFIQNPENKPCVNHKNGIKTDNRLENLEWCTYSENNQHAYDTGLKAIKRGLNHWYHKKEGHIHNMLGKTGYECKNSKTVYQFDMNMNLIKEFGSSHEAQKELGFPYGSICRAARGGKSAYRGFIWKYYLPSNLEIHHTTFS